jgi:hypothetical protein
MFKPCGGCRQIHRQLDGFGWVTVTTFHLIAFSSPDGFPSGWAASNPASRLPAARPLARGGVSVMAYNPVSTVRNRPFIPEICFITSSIFLRPNLSMGIVPVCAPLGAIRFELGAIVSTMMSGIQFEIWMSDGNGFVPIG